MPKDVSRRQTTVDPYPLAGRRQHQYEYEDPEVTFLSLCGDPNSAVSRLDEYVAYDIAQLAGAESHEKEEQLKKHRDSFYSDKKERILQILHEIALQLGEAFGELHYATTEEEARVVWDKINKLNSESVNFQNELNYLN
jgi:hypothetical protein